MVKSNILMKYTLYLGSQIFALLAADKMIGIEDWKLVVYYTINVVSPWRLLFGDFQYLITRVLFWKKFWTNI